LDSKNEQNAPTRKHMYTHMRVYVHVYAYIYTYTHTYIYTHMHMHTYTHTCTQLHICMDMHTYTQIENHNPSFRGSKCHEREQKMKTKGKRLNGIVFTNTIPRHAEKLHDLQGGDTTMPMQQVREVMMVNQEMKDTLRSEFADENHGEAGSSKQCNDQRTDQTAFFWHLSSQISFETQKGNSMIRSYTMRLKCWMWNEQRQ